MVNTIIIVMYKCVLSKHKFIVSGNLVNFP